MEKRIVRTLYYILSLLRQDAEIITVHDADTHLVEGIPVLLSDYNRGRIIITSEQDEGQVKEEYGIE